jgi:proteasome lid subunit RPN8/RPN11
MNATPSAPTSDAIIIHDAAIETIRRHAASTYPHECCGALTTLNGAIADAFPLPNVTEEGAARRFLIGPSQYRAAEARASELGGTLAGFYHSHPDHPARPSQHDLDHAWPNFVYVIVSVQAGSPEAITCWRLRDDRSAFEPRDLQWPTKS